MEYSPMLVFMLWALTPSDASFSSEGGESAVVQELPQPLMSVQSFTFNHGKPFLAERDPLTGALDLRTTPVAKGAQDDYLYEEFEESGETIDRKDGLSSQNIITPYTKSKESELHKFLNLPVHYSSSGKYPLVSSSYANTKIQGHASNHRTSSTSSTAQTPSTVVPSYYPHRTTSITTTTTKPTTSTQPTPKITSTISTTTTTTTTSSPLYEYEYEYDYSDKPTKGDYEFLGVSSEVTNNGSSDMNGGSNDSPRPFTQLPIEENSTSKESNKDNKVSESNQHNIYDNNLTSDKKTEFTNRGTIKYHTSSSTTERPLTVTTSKVNSFENRITTERYYPTNFISQSSTTKIPSIESPNAQTDSQLKFNKTVVVTVEPIETFPTTEEDIEEKVIEVKQPSKTGIVTTIRPVIESNKSSTELDKFESTTLKPLNKEPNNNNLFKPHIVDYISGLRPPTQQQHNIPEHTSYGINKDAEMRPPHQQEKFPSSSGIEVAPSKPQEIRNPSQVNPLHPVGIDKPQRVQDVEKPMRPSGIDSPLRPPGIDNPSTLPQFVQLRPPLRPPGMIIRPPLRPHEFESTNLKPQSTHQQHPRPHDDLYNSRPQSVPQQHITRPQEVDPSQHSRPQIRPPQYESYRPPQKIDFNNPHENKEAPIKQKENHQQLRPVESDYPKKTQVSHLPPIRPGFNQHQSEIENRPFPRPVNEEVVWPAVRPHVPNIKPNKPPYTFFVPKQSEKESDKKKYQDQDGGKGVGSVESVNIGQPSKVQSHFIQVSPGQENPSYSLQTSFSIGVPPPSAPKPEGPTSIHFPQEEPPKKFPWPQWDSQLKHPIKHRHPLPNILPQFRPNAKVGHVEPPVQPYVREPLDTLQPPPLPRPEFLHAEEPLVHRRNGQSSHVTTLQMMQTPLRGALRAEDKDEPVFVVYPSNGGEGVVVGTRGPQRPLPPDNLNINNNEQLDSFPLENEDFKARVDTPILKGKPTKPIIIKNEFPYPLIKPDIRIEEDKSKTTYTFKEYSAFSPTVPSVEKDNNAEINVIPYLQDYMPFATKKPQPKEPLWSVGSDTKPISVTLSTKTTTQPVPISNHKPQDSRPTPLDFQAPFQASLTAPNRGWSVVQKRNENEIVPTQNSSSTTTQATVETTQESVFDAQNFKPQLFGGFKPILPPEEDIKAETDR